MKRLNSLVIGLILSLAVLLTVSWFKATSIEKQVVESTEDQKQNAKIKREQAKNEFQTDLMLNVASEIAGVILTLLLVDTWIENRERTRWKPFRFRSLMHVCSSVNNFIDALSQMAHLEDENLSLLVREYRVDFKLDDALRKTSEIREKVGLLSKIPPSKLFVELLKLQIAARSLEESVKEMQSNPLTDAEGHDVLDRLKFYLSTMLTSLEPFQITSDNALYEAHPELDLRPHFWNALPNEIKSVLDSIELVCNYLKTWEREFQT